MARTLYGPDTVLRRGSIMVIDQSGFTRKVLLRGAAFALRDIWKMRSLLVPSLREFGAEIFKIDADNIYAWFPKVEPAISAASAAHRLLQRSEARRVDPLRVCIGIGYGELHYVSSEDDYYGAEVNLASKLGEDIAEGGCTLLTQNALAAIREPVAGSAGPIRYARISQVRIGFREWIA